MASRILLALALAVFVQSTPECTNSGPYPDLLPHEYDCNKYYVCSHGRAQLMSCGEGTEFNPVLKVCDWPYNSGCLTKSTTPQISTRTAVATGKPISSPQPNAGQSTTEQADIVPECPPGDSYAYLLPNPKDCNKFYSCSNGVPVPMRCGEGLHFNPNLMVCDWPENAGCDDSGHDTTKEPIVSTLEPHISEPNLSTSGNNLSTSNPILSTSRPNISTTGPSNTDNYVANIETTKPASTRQTDTEGTTKSKTVTESDGPGGGTTKSDVITTEPNVSTPKTNDSTDGESISESDPSLTTLNYLLTDWDDTTSEPDVSTTQSDSSTEDSVSTTGSSKPTTETDNSDAESTTSEGSSTGSVPGCPPDDPNRYLLPNPKDCTKFYSCSNGYPYPMQCQKGLHFNAELMVCDWPNHAGCDTTGQSTSSTTNSYTSTSDSEASTSNPTVSTERIPPVIIPGCPPEDPYKYLLPNQNNCTKFYSCAHGLAYPMQCGDGLYFNPDLQVCDWPENVDCPSDLKTTTLTTLQQ